MHCHQPMNALRASVRMEIKKYKAVECIMLYHIIRLGSIPSVVRFFGGGNVGGKLGPGGDVGRGSCGKGYSMHGGFTSTKNCNTDAVRRKLLGVVCVQIYRRSGWVSGSPRSLHQDLQITSRQILFHQTSGT